MYLNIGNDIIIYWEEILFILTEKQGLLNKEVIQGIEDKSLENYDSNKTNSFIFTERKGRKKIYASSFTTGTLCKRFLP